MQPRARKTKILNQFLLFILPFVILAVSVTSGVLMWTSYRAFHNTIAQDYHNIIKASAGEIRLFMAFAQKKLGTLAWVLATDGTNHYGQEMALAAFNQVNREFSQVSLISPSGEIIASTSWTDKDKNILDDQLLRKALAGQSAFSDIWFAKEQLPHLSLAVPFPSFAKTRQVVVGGLNLKHVWDVLEGITIGGSGHIYIMDLSGRYIAHRQIDQVLSAAPPIAADVLKDIRLAVSPVAWFEKNQHETFYCLGSYISQLDWIIVLRQPTREIYYYLFRNLYWAGLITVLACLVATVLGWNRINKFLKPIKTMHQQVHQIGVGNLDQQVTVTSTNEIGDLGMAFNEMTASLKKIIQREIRTARDLAHAKNLAVLGVSASKVTHEVGNLLNNVGLSVNVLKDETLSPHGKQALSKMELESARTRGFLQDFLKFAKPPELKPTPVAIGLIIREVLAMHAPAARARGITLDLNWPSQVPDILADTQLIYQAFNNLIKNSTEATESNGYVRVTGKLDTDYLNITIEDSGAGIAPEHLEQIFEPFFTTKGKAGTGLGMAIVQSIITAHRGTIACQSEPGKGTCMFIRLPLQ